jgi:O-methyltransferase
MFKSFLNKIFLKAPPRLPEDVMRVMNLPTYKPSYNEDGLYTNHNCDFLAGKKFQDAYDLYFTTGSSQGWHLRWRVHILLWAASVATHLEGDFVECGTYLGGSARAIITYVNFNRLNKSFYLIDSYEGLPREHQHLHYYKEENYYDQVRAYFLAYPRTKLVKGIIPDVLLTETFGRVSLLHIDLGVPGAEIGALRFFWDKLAPGAMVVLDYYAYPVSNSKEIKAGYDAFAEEKGFEICYLPTGQGMIVKI